MWKGHSCRCAWVVSLPPRLATFHIKYNNNMYRRTLNNIFLLADKRALNKSMSFLLLKNRGGDNGLFNIRKHFVIDIKIQNMLFKLQKKFNVNSEGAVIRRAIVELYQNNFKT